MLNCIFLLGSNSIDSVAMMDRIILDESALSCILRFINEPRARPCSKAWDEFLTASLHLKSRSEFYKLIQARGKLFFHHSAVRSMGPDFEECISYNFELSPSGEYFLQWTRTFDQWSSDSERQVGNWRISDDHMLFESSQSPSMAEANCVRFADAGRRFAVPLHRLLQERTQADVVSEDWEFEARGLQVQRWIESGQNSSHDVEPQRAMEARFEPAEDVRYVDIDGEMHEVSADIREHWPEADWERLMRCRVRFGIRGFA